MSSRKRRFVMAYAAIITNSSTRESKVAAAAPATPKAGAPRLPKISTQFKKVLAHMEQEKITVPSFGFSIAR